ncbi:MULTISPECIES: PAC2 family protein [Arthrobacter]|uniref:PAC2 family protein n=2 Tax=Arthrobacter TaxID=1663 RepID=A0ABU9KGJ7_9MICC|nr:PAC2 family protein [Arthrobacter sp. YJM1]MDP5225939.1 PAC2 family protein [Arthrobacter sp. YJM1]
MESYDDQHGPSDEAFLPRDGDGTRRTVLIAAFEGWNDAGEAASDTIRFLSKAWHAQKVSVLEPDDYYDFQFTRPTVRTTGSGERKLRWPGTRIHRASVPGAPLDVILVSGVEPSYRWRAFTAEILARAEELGVDRVLLLGALLADVPHTRPLPVTVTTDDRALQERLNLEPATYQGPTGIIGVLGEVARLAGLPAVSLWATVPHYVAQSPSPKAQLALLHRIEELLQVPVEPGDLAEDAEAWERGVNELAADDPDIAGYVRQLEEATDTAELPEATGESIAREFERYLRRRGKGHGHPHPDAS